LAVICHFAARIFVEKNEAIAGIGAKGVGLIIFSLKSKCCVSFQEFIETGKNCKTIMQTALLAYV